MIRSLILSIACVALICIACKSGNKEVTETPTTDTIAMQATPPVTTDTVASSATGQNNTTAPNTSSNTTGAATAATAKVTNAPGAPDEMGYYTMPEKKPLYPGGEPAFNKYLADNLRYPSDARENNIQGTVYASLLVNEQGKIVDVSIVSKPFGYGLEEEVMRVIKAMPQWSPGEFNHKAVKTRFTLPVKFALK